ncbi:MAG: hypothetical protein HRF45_13185 [Fimbriimonadia bacterium]|jgi:N-acetylglucosamine kinase
MSEEQFAGLVGGGSVTECVLCNAQGEVVGVGCAGPCNTNFVRESEARAAIREAVSQAFANVGRCVAAGVAVAGGFSEETPGLEAAGAGLSERCGRVVRYAEHQAALAACGVYEDEGVAVVAGTGSSAVAYRNGRHASAGGWGSLLGDEGSGWDIAVKALRAATRSHDGAGPKSEPLERAVKEHFGADCLWDLVRVVYRDGVPRARIAALCKRLAVEQDDPVVAGLFSRAAADLAAVAVAAAAKLYDRSDPVTFALSGGVWKAGDPLCETFREMVRVRYGGARFVSEQRSPAHGLAIRTMTDWRKR